MAFNSVLDKVDDRVKITPPDTFVHALGELILANAQVAADGTYSVDGLIVGYKHEYQEWMKAQGICNLWVTIPEIDCYKLRMRFVIRRV